MNNECRPERCGVASKFTIKLSSAGNGVLKVEPSVLAVLAGDQVTWEYSGKNFSVSFSGGSPFEPYSPTDEPGRPRVIDSDHGVVFGDIHREAAGGAHFYDVIVHEGAQPLSAKAVLLVEVTAGVIVRGPVDPV